VGEPTSWGINYDFSLRLIVRNVHQVAHLFTVNTNGPLEGDKPLGKVEN
jgi:hypothetical protein